MDNFFAPKIRRQNSLSAHIQRLYSTAIVVTIARLAQSVEHETLNLRVVGSSPTLGVQLFALGKNRTNRTEMHEFLEDSKGIISVARPDF